MGSIVPGYFFYDLYDSAANATAGTGVGRMTLTVQVTANVVTPARLSGANATLLHG